MNAQQREAIRRARPDRASRGRSQDYLQLL